MAKNKKIWISLGTITAIAGISTIGTLTYLLANNKNKIDNTKQNENLAKMDQLIEKIKTELTANNDLSDSQITALNLNFFNWLNNEKKILDNTKNINDLNLEELITKIETHFSTYQNQYNGLVNLKNKILVVTNLINEYSIPEEVEDKDLIVVNALADLNNANDEEKEKYNSQDLSVLEDGLVNLDHVYQAQLQILNNNKQRIQAEKTNLNQIIAEVQQIIDSNTDTANNPEVTEKLAKLKEILSLAKNSYVNNYVSLSTLESTKNNLSTAKSEFEASIQNNN
ncbi:hypothetical protein [Mycoplasmopsis gallinarum]|uniref:Uncharacterized protein n=1 Tax=Mycoplasmopsis gallinarum TaxID=29557 RepID=A0A168RBS9_9BACT|nr:hypothetical protein [Mycoplasmopsis gallinarum]OAB48814.1 hypothetical protein MGALLINA_03830 [Mycoplasmopsis gallinarum]